MKKKLFSAVVLFCSLSVFAFTQEIQLPKVTYSFQKGQDVPNAVAGKVIYAEKNTKKVLKSSMNVPEELADGVVIVQYEESYYYHNELNVKKFEILFSNVEPDAKYTKATEKNGIDVKPNDILGKAKGEISLIIRARSLDPHLVLCADTVALENGPYWYFGLASMNPQVAKYLTFQPINSIEDKITFSDGISESFKQIVTSHESDNVNSYPPMPVKFKTALNSYPVQKHPITNSGEKTIHTQYLSNIDLECVFDLNGINVHVYYPNNFADYFRQEYKLGNSVVIFGNLLYVYKNELHIYGRDFALTDPEETVNKKQNYFIQLNRKNRVLQNRKTPVDESSDYVDVTQTIPEGGYAVYERFFFQDKNSPTGYKENHTNSAIEYFDKNGNKVARMFPYDDTDLIRSTQLYKYDDKNRMIEYYNYDSDMYQVQGKWTVNPARSRLFNRKVTEYKDTEDGYEGVTQAYRYSYKPRVEHLENEITKKYNAQGVLLSYRDISITGDMPDTIEEYDEKGNMIYEKGFGEEKYENKYEYTYNSDKILTKKSIDLLSGSVIETIYEYDASDRLISCKSENFTTTYKYNSKGKLIEKCRLDKDGKLSSRNTMRYDDKTGILIFNYEENFGSYSSKRFWYYEFSKNNWDMELTPEKLLESLPE